MSEVQQGILAPIPALARHLFFSTRPDADPGPRLAELAERVDGDSVVLGVGESLVRALGRSVTGLTAFSEHATAGVDVPSTPMALWCWLRGDDRGELLHRGREVASYVAPDLRLALSIDAFRYKSGLDLTGYEDGTENPTGDEALAAAIVSGQGPGLDGGSLVAVQQWTHDLDRFQRMLPTEQDNTFGRRRLDNVELDDAPASAHVKRTAQESFEPEAFVLRRSMPWSEGEKSGLVFVAFGRSTTAFEAQLRRMVGLEDGITDGLFRFTRPVTGGYFWCPPMREDRVDLSALGL